MSLIRVSKRVDGSWTCPSEGSFYACASGSRFVGCCTADPCTNGCPDGNMQPVGFNSDNHGTFPDASCGAASQFYTCASGNQTFWGCCKSNPCAQGQTCPAADLTPAFMDRPEQLGAYVTGVSSTTSATSSPTASRTPTPGSDDDDGGSNIGAIVGGTVGGVLGLAIIGAVLIFILRKRKQQKDNSPGKPGSAGSSNAAYDAVPSGEKNNKNLRASTFADGESMSLSQTKLYINTNNDPSTTSLHLPKPKHLLKPTIRLPNLRPIQRAPISRDPGTASRHVTACARSAIFRTSSRCGGADSNGGIRESGDDAENTTDGV